MTATRLVAPVGSEVVVVAGICGPEGHFVTRQPIEWHLSQESVGNLVDAGDEDSYRVCSWLPRSSSRIVGNSVVARTSTTARVITRGTPSFEDDVWIKRGQSWVSVTSSAEGASYVTAVAPGAENWNQRRQTVTIHWVDAQWSLPGPAIVRAGQAQELTTTITRATDGKPAPGWIVRYEVAGGAPAGFGPSGQASAEVTSDANGRATVQLLPVGAQPGVTQVRIEIIMPSSDSAPSSRAVVGQGWTTVTWSSAGLAVRIHGTESVAVDGTAAFRVEVSNPGDLATRNVTLAVNVPALLRFTSSTPPAEMFGSRLQWRLGDLNPRETRTLDLNCRAVREGDVRLCAQAQADGKLTAEGCTSLQIMAPAVEVRFVNPPQTAKVGERVRFDIEVVNVSSRRLTNVVARDTFEPGLQHATGEVSPIVRALGDLEPKGTRGFSVSFIVRKPGRLCHTLDVTAAGGHAASARACLDATQVVLAVDVAIAGPGQRRVGETAEYVIRVTNTGDAPLTGVRLAFYAEPTLLAEKASPGYQYREGALQWDLGTLQPQDAQSRTVQCACIKVDPAAETRATVTSTEGATRTATASTEILAAVVPPPATAQPALQPPADVTSPPEGGQLRVSIADTADPVRVGGTTTYLVILQNDRKASDRDVVVTFVLPEGMKFQRFDSGGLPLTARQGAGGQTISLSPIQELRPGETLRPMRVDVTLTQPGSLRFRVEVKSLRHPTPVVEEEDTRVQAN